MRVGKTENTFVIFFTENIPDSRAGLLFGWRAAIGGTVGFPGAVVVAVVGCKGD